MLKTATAQMERLNLRKRRADQIAALIFRAVDPYVADECRNRAFRAITEALMIEGVELLTDYDRQQMGLPARGPDGWTVEEIVALERHRLELLTKPLTMPFQTGEMIAGRKD